MQMQEVIEKLKDILASEGKRDLKKRYSQRIRNQS